MSIPRLLNIPLVFLLDNSNYVWAREMLEHLSADSFGGKIYVFSHYINASVKTDFCTAYPSLMWIEAGETMIYEQLCADGKRTPVRITFYLLPELLKESQIVVLWKLIERQSFVKMTNQIRSWQQTRIPFVETKQFSYLDLDLLRTTGAFSQFIEGE